MRESPDFQALIACEGQPDAALLDRLVRDDPDELALFLGASREVLGDLHMGKRELAATLATVDAIDRAFWRAEQPGEAYIDWRTQIAAGFECATA